MGPRSGCKVVVVPARAVWHTRYARFRSQRAPPGNERQQADARPLVAREYARPTSLRICESALPERTSFFSMKKLKVPSAVTPQASHGYGSPDESSLSAFYATPHGQPFGPNASAGGSRSPLFAPGGGGPMMSGSQQTYGSIGWGMSDAPSHTSASYHSGPSHAWMAPQTQEHAQAQYDKVSGLLSPSMGGGAVPLRRKELRDPQRLRYMEHLDPQTLFSFPLSAPSRAFHTSSSPFARDYGHGSSSYSNSTYTNTNMDMNTQVFRRDRAHPEVMEGMHSYSNDPDLCACHSFDCVDSVRPLTHPEPIPVQFDDF